jgi:uncharacterized membrane protein (UPF0136 family)
MSFPVIVLAVYGLLMLVGGVMGQRAGSRASLVAGGASGVLLLVAAWLAAGAAPQLGLWLGVLVAVALAITFGVRLLKTGKVMPAGGLLAISVIALVLLALSATRG